MVVVNVRGEGGATLLKRLKYGARVLSHHEALKIILHFEYSTHEANLKPRCLTKKRASI